MNELGQKIKDEIIKNIEYIFGPIDGKFVSFEKSSDIYCCVRQAYSTEDIFIEKNKTTFYPTVLGTKFGELRMNIHSTELPNIKLAIGIGYAYSSFDSLNKVPKEISLEIQNRIYLNK